MKFSDVYGNNPDTKLYPSYGWYFPAICQSMEVLIKRYRVFTLKEWLRSVVMTASNRQIEEILIMDTDSMRYTSVLRLFTVKMSVISTSDCFVLAWLISKHIIGTGTSFSTLPLSLSSFAPKYLYFVMNRLSKNENNINA